MRSRLLTVLAAALVGVVPSAGVETAGFSRRDARVIVVYACSNDPDRVGFYKINVRTGARFDRLTEDPGYDDKDPRWSPDRRWIAWVRGWSFDEGSEGSAGEIRVMRADGTREKRLTSTERPNLDPDWSPDSTRLVFERGTGSRSDIVTIRADGRRERRLTRDDGVDIDPVWSPDGRWIAWSSDGAIRKMRADGTDKRKLTGRAEREPGVEDFAPRWSPSGKKVLFVRRLPGRVQSNMELFVIGANGRGLRRLTSTRASEYEHSWSPTGGKIVFQRRLWDPESSRQHLWVMRADGGDQVRLTGDLAPGGQFFSFYPTWSIDGKRVAFSRPRGRCERSDIWVARADGSGVRQVTATDDLGEFKPNWYSRGGQEEPH